MSNAAAPFVAMFQFATAAFSEGQSILSESAQLAGDEKRQSAELGHQAMTSGFRQLEALGKRYAALPECNGANSQPILSDPHFRAATLECASQLVAPGNTGIAAKRIAALLRRWVETNDPAAARALAALCDAASRISKTRSARAAA